VYALGQYIRGFGHNVILSLCHSIPSLPRRNMIAKHDSQRLLLDMDQEFPIGASTVHNSRIERPKYETLIKIYVVCVLRPSTASVKRLVKN
jgi:hypothetical protein